uniref:Extracellular calcium-sensing receptor-like n=1 Tax=Callorhinchus milii TaxID=7868 RepID=A0A4W3GWZ3_CALMI
MYSCCILFLLVLGTGVLGANQSLCKLRGKFDLPELSMGGDVLLGGLFQIHTKIITLRDVKNPPFYSFNFRAFRWAQTMIFAIEEVNKDPTLLPNITLGYRIYDSCGKHPMSLRAAITLVNGQEETVSSSRCTASNVTVIIGDPSSTQSMILSQTLAPFQIPVLSYYSTCSCLSNKFEFPTFLRTIPSDNYQVKAMAQLVKRFGWTWIGFVANDDDYGQYGLQIFKDEIQHSGVCIAFIEFVPKIYSKAKVLNIVDTIKISSARVVILFAGDVVLLPVMKELLKQNVTGRQWIASESAIVSGLLSVKELYPVMGGTIGTTILGFPGDNFVHEFWGTMFNCTFKKVENVHEGTYLQQPCTGFEDLTEQENTYSDVSQLRISYNVYKAVYSVAHALQNLLLCVNDEGPFENRKCADILNLQPGQVRKCNQVKFRSKLGEDIYFDENGDVVAFYDILNWQLDTEGNVQYVKVGRFDASLGRGQELDINEELIFWREGQTTVVKSKCSESCPPGTRKGVRKGQPLCCFDCIPCADAEISNQTNSIECTKCPLDYWSNEQRDSCIPKEIEFLSFEDDLGIVLSVVALSGTFTTIAVAAVFFYHRNTPIVRANNSELSFLLLLSLCFCFLCSLTFIGEPLVWSCMLRHTAFGISFALCISCILGKTIVVLMAFKATLPNNNRMKWLGPTQQRSIVFVSTGIQVIICTLWLATSPPFPTQSKFRSAKLLLECDVGSVTAFSCMLGYIGLLACLCFVLAFFARKLPDNFNEAKFITFSMIIFCAVWLTFIPAYVSTPGKYTVAVEIFAILSSSTGLLGCIFVPKCYIIMLKPEQNTKKHLMGK